VPCWITHRISLCLYDAPAESATIGIVDRHFANQVARQFHSIDRKFRSPETSKAKKGRRTYAFHY
jgi:hypothetical protein